jgi:hypothetical protein
MGLRRIVATCSVTALALLAAPTARAASYYVNDSSAAGDVVLPGCTNAPLGADVAGCGTCAMPCRSPNYVYANQPLGANDVVYLNAGDYLPAPSPSSSFLDATGGKFGVSGNPLIFRGTIDARGKPLTRFNGQATAQAGVNIGVPWVWVENVSITNTGCPSGAPYGSGAFVAIANLPGVRFHNLEVFGTTCGFGAPIDFESTANPCVGCEVSHCYLHDNGADTGAGVWVKATGGLRVTRNVITRNAPANAAFPGIVLQGTINAVVDGNLIYGNGGAAISLTRCSGCPAMDSVTVRNNTFWRNQLAASGNSTAEVVLVQTVTNLTFENNIVGCALRSCLDSDNNSTFASSNYNDWFITGSAMFGTKGGSTAADLPAWRTATALDAQSLSVDPLFASASDFHLQSIAGRPDDATGMRAFDAQNSPLLDRGNPLTALGVEPAPNGKRVDIGAFGGTAEASLTPVVLINVSGSGQSGPAGAQLPQPLVIEVNGTGTGIKEAGVAVAFGPASGSSGTVSSPSAFTDDAGRAIAFVAPGAGTQTFVATLPGIGGIAPAQFVVFGIGPDGGVPDGGVPDGGVPDGGVPDGGVPDGGVPDGGVPDGGAPDGGFTDAGTSSDAGVADAGQNDGGSSTADAGTIPVGPVPSARCGAEWTHAVVLSPPDGWTWSVTDGPEGLVVDANTGALRWTPAPRQSGTNDVALRAERSGGAIDALLTVPVECETNVSLGTGCSCAAPAGSLGAIAWLLLVAGVRRRRVK